MSDTVIFWLQNLYDREIKEAEDTIKNEKFMSLGYKGSENPHNSNIQILKEYISKLNELKSSLTNNIE